jgi:hypothetical protein
MFDQSEKLVVKLIATRTHVLLSIYMLTWVIYKAQHSDTGLVLDRTRKPFQCNALLADLGKYFQNLNF